MRCEDSSNTVDRRRLGRPCRVSSVVLFISRHRSKVALDGVAAAMASVPVLKSYAISSLLWQMDLGAHIARTVCRSDDVMISIYEIAPSSTSWRASQSVRSAEIRHRRRHMNLLNLCFQLWLSHSYIYGRHYMISYEIWHRYSCYKGICKLCTVIVL